MTPEEKALRDAFLAECWRPVHEWHPTPEERVWAEARAQLSHSFPDAVSTPVEEAS